MVNIINLYVLNEKGFDILENIQRAKLFLLSTNKRLIINGESVEKQEIKLVLLEKEDEDYIIEKIYENLEKEIHGNYYMHVFISPEKTSNYRKITTIVEIMNVLAINNMQISFEIFDVDEYNYGFWTDVLNGTFLNQIFSSENIELLDIHKKETNEYIISEIKRIREICKLRIKDRVVSVKESFYNDSKHKEREYYKWKFEEKNKDKKD